MKSSKTDKGRKPPVSTRTRAPKAEATPPRTTGLKTAPPATPRTIRELRLGHAKPRRRTATTTDVNPLREGLRLERMPDPHVVVLFGATGDLSHRKVFPALAQLWRTNLLPQDWMLIAVGRRPHHDDDFRAEIAATLAKNSRVPLEPAVAEQFLEKIVYHQGDFSDDKMFDKLKARIEGLGHEFGATANVLFYLATQPSAFATIVAQLGRCGLDHELHNGGWRRVIIEKPFGRDLDTAKKLNELLHKSFCEEQIFRIDHYLGKETVQNLMVMRFANSIFEPLWNHKYIDHVQITVSETLGVGTRGGYYDKSGALRDMVQNHLFQLMSLVAMEPPPGLDATSIRDEKVKVYKSVRPVKLDTVVRGQYTAGDFDGEHTDGYRHEKGVPPTSITETFVALKLYIDNWRWSGTPFYLRTGKFLSQKMSEVAVRFRAPPLTLFQKQCESPVYPNDLIIRVQPDEGISLRINGKVPGGHMNIKPVALDFFYKTTFHVEPPEAYERLIHDAMTGDPTLFIRGDEVEAAWSVIDPIEKAIEQKSAPPEEYKPGSWGPRRAFDLIELDGRRWLGSNGETEEPIIACSL